MTMKKTNLTRCLSVLLVLVMAFVLLLSGCKKAPADDTTTTTTTTAATTTTGSGSEDGASTTSGNGTTTTGKTTSGNSVSTTTAAAGSVTNMPLEKPVTFTVFLQEHPNQPVKLDAMKWNAVKSLTNVTLDVDVASSSTATSKLQAASASGKMYDITILQYAHLRNLKESLFMDVTELMKTKTPNYYNLVKDDPDLNLFRINGKFRGFCMFVNDTVTEEYESQPIVTAIRKDVLTKNNLKVPTTWEEWFTVMKALKKKYPSSTPYSGRAMSYITDYWTQALTGYRPGINYSTRDGKYVAGVLQSNFRSALQFMKSCYDEGILDPNFDNLSAASFAEGAADNKVFFWIDNGVNLVSQNNALQQVDKNAAFVEMNLMKSHLNSNKKSGMAITQTTNYVQMYCLSSQTQHKEELLQFMDWCYSHEGMLTNNLGIQGETYELNSDGSPYVPQNIWQKYASNVMPEYAWMSDLGLGQLCFAPRVLSNSGVEWKGRPLVKETADAAYKSALAADFKAGCYDTNVYITPDIDSTKQSQYATINKYIGTQMVRFIKGTRAMSEFNTFISELEKMGLPALVDACNKAK